LATKNTRLAALYLGATLGGTYTRITKTHGLKLNVPTDFSEDTSHGDRFKSYLPGLQDFSATIMAWYDTATTTLEAMSLNKVSEYFLIYPDYTDTQNYYRGQMYIGMDELNLDLGNTADFQYTGRIANADIAIIRAGAAL
jgi:hypothetical protein